MFGNKDLVNIVSNKMDFQETAKKILKCYYNETVLDNISNHFVLVLRDYFINHFLKENKNLNLQRQPSL